MQRVAVMTCKYLGSRVQAAKDEMPAMQIYELVTDCYVAELDQIVGANQNKSTKPNLQHYVLSSDIEQNKILAVLEPNKIYRCQFGFQPVLRGQANKIAKDKLVFYKAELVAQQKAA